MLASTSSPKGPSPRLAPGSASARPSPAVPCQALRLRRRADTDPPSATWSSGSPAVALSAGKDPPAVVLRPELTVGNLSYDTRGESPWDAWLSHVSQRQVRLLRSVCENRPAGFLARLPAEPRGPELQASAACGALGGDWGLRRETGARPPCPQGAQEQGAEVAAEKTHSAPLARSVSPP